MIPDLPPLIQPAWEELQKSIVYVTFVPTCALAALAVFVIVRAAATMSVQVLHNMVDISLGKGEEVEPVPFVHEISAKLQ